MCASVCMSVWANEMAGRSGVTRQEQGCIEGFRAAG